MTGAAFCLATTTDSQETYYSIFSYRHFIPEVRANRHSVGLQHSLYPDYYRTQAAADDMRWVRQNDSQLVAFWQEQGDTVLHILTELSGLEWREREFDIYFVRYYPTIGSDEPLVVPIGGLRTPTLTEAAPTGKQQILNLIYQLARRMLTQAARPEDGFFHPVAYHPLMRHGPYRRDNLAMLLAVATCRNVLGLDSTSAALNSAFWNRHLPGRRILESFLLDKWALTPDRTLADWTLAESYSSPLVLATRPPRASKTAVSRPLQGHIEGLPAGGQLGFSVRVDDQGYLVVDTIDVSRLAYACGLEPGDRIRAVNGYHVQTHRQLVERILAELDRGGALLQVLRADELTSVLIRPILAPGALDSLFPDSSLLPVENPPVPVPDTTLSDTVEK